MNDIIDELSHIEFEDMQEYWVNMSEAGKIWLEIIELMQRHPPEGSKKALEFDPLNSTPAMFNAWFNFWREPEKVIRQTGEYWSDMMSIWQHYFIDPTSHTDALNKIPKGGRRFKYEEWQENAHYAFMRSAYLYFQKWIDNAIMSAHGLTEEDRRVAGFVSRNMVESLNPANFAATNPEVLAVTREEKGANLVRGMKMLRDDLERGKGQLLIRQVDYSKFKVGENIAVTPGKVIYECEQFQIIQYAPSTKQVEEKPIFFVPPWINKYYILDLNEKKSYAKWIVDQGYTVFMLSWVNADTRHGNLTWVDRMNAVSEAIDVVNKECGTDQCHMISFCIGGTLMGTLLADMDKRGDTRVASSTFLTAQFDFVHSGELQAFVNEKSVALLDAHDEKGFIPAESMSQAFNLLRANDLIWSYIVNNYMLGRDPMAFDLLYWNSDSMRMPTKIQKFYLDQFYLKNAFMKDGIDGPNGKVVVSDITTPSYHLSAIEDHIAPAASVYVAARAMKAKEVRYVLTGSGHIAGVINPPSLEKYQYWRNDNLTAMTLEEWRRGATEHPGSWWLDWKEWIDARKTKNVPARKPGKVNGVVEDAPGSYVQVRFDTDAPS